MECVYIKTDLMVSCPERSSKFQDNSRFQLSTWLRQLENATVAEINANPNFTVVLELGSPISCYT